MSHASDQVKKKDCFLRWFLVRVVDLIRKGKDQGKKLGVGAYSGPPWQGAAPLSERRAC